MENDSYVIWDNNTNAFIGVQVSRVSSIERAKLFNYTDAKDFVSGYMHLHVLRVTYIPRVELFIVYYPFADKERYLAARGDGTYMLTEAKKNATHFLTRKLAQEAMDANRVLGGILEIQE